MAEAKLDEFLREHRQQRSNREASSKMTFDQAAAIYLRSLGDNLNIKPRHARVLAGSVGGASEKLAAIE